MGSLMDDSDADYFDAACDAAAMDVVASADGLLQSPPIVVEQEGSSGSCGIATGSAESFARGTCRPSAHAELDQPRKRRAINLPVLTHSPASACSSSGHGALAPSVVLQEDAGQPLLPAAEGLVGGMAAENIMPRRRLRKKTRCPWLAQPSHVRRRHNRKGRMRVGDVAHCLATCNGSVPVDVVSLLKRAMGTRGHRELWERLRRHAGRERNGREGVLGEYLGRQRVWRTEWRDTPENLRPKKMCDLICRQREYCCNLLRGYYARCDGREDVYAAEPHARLGALGTWNGSWIMQHGEVVGAISASTSADDLASKLRSLKPGEELFKRFLSFMEQRRLKSRFKFFSVQLEVSPEVWREGRVHFHCYWSYPTESMIGAPIDWRFAGSVPLIVSNKQHKRAGEKACNHGHYYCQADKVGWVMRQTNYEKGKMFPVKLAWVSELRALNKVSKQAFVKEALHAKASRTMGVLRDVAQQEAAIAALRQEEEAAAVQLAIRGGLRPFRVVPEVVEWQRQYVPASEGGPRDTLGRFKFLVLNGDSCTGKSRFARSLFKNPYVVQCQGVPEPDLRNFSREDHGSIICEEACWRMVAGNKWALQAQDESVWMAQTRCQIASYQVWLWAKPIIVCCNDWLHGADATTDGKTIGWLEANSVVVQVTQPLFL